MISVSYHCHFCERTFTRESNFLKHRCKYMARYEQLNTPMGQASWLFYQTWMRLQKRRVLDQNSFIQSRFYMSFIRFSEFVKKAQIPRPDLFIRIMVEKKLQPTIWANDATYSHYIQYLDHKTNPKELVDITIDTLFSKSEELGCDVSLIFDNIEPSELIELVRERKASPWFLLNSKKFAKFLAQLKYTNRGQYIILQTLINIKVWKSRFDHHPNLIKEIKTYVDEMSL